MKKPKFNTGIYQIVNLVNGKRYIGSSDNLRKRKYNHFNRLKRGKHDNSYLQRSYNKYGKENFKFEEIVHCPVELLFFFEQKCADRYNLKTELYNIRKIVESNRGLPHSEKTKKKIGEAQRGEKNHNYGKKASKETREKKSKSLRGINNPNYGKKGKNHPLCGRERPKEVKDKISKSKKENFHPFRGVKGKEHYFSKQVYQIDKTTLKIIKKWDSITEAQNELKIGHISDVCNGNRNQSGGFIWAFIGSDFTKINPIKYQKVYQLNKNTLEVIKEWENISDAKRELKIKNILNVCNFKSNTAGGFRWVFSIEDIYKINIHKKHHLSNKIGERNNNAKSIYQIDIKTNKIIKKWGSLMDVQRSLGINIANISSVCRNTRKTAGSFKWAYVKDYDKN